MARKIPKEINDRLKEISKHIQTVNRCKVSMPEVVGMTSEEMMTLSKFGDGSRVPTIIREDIRMVKRDGYIMVNVYKKLQQKYREGAKKGGVEGGKNAVNEYVQSLIKKNRSLNAEDDMRESMEVTTTLLGNKIGLGY